MVKVGLKIEKKECYEEHNRPLFVDMWWPHIKGFLMVTGRWISIWRDFGFGGKFKSQVPELNLVPIQHVPIENGGTAVRA